MTDQQPEAEDIFERFMRHITDHGCDRKHCKIAEDLALKALIARQQDWGFTGTKEDVIK